MVTTDCASPRVVRLLSEVYDEITNGAHSGYHRTYKILATTSYYDPYYFGRDLRGSVSDLCLIARFALDSILASEELTITRFCVFSAWSMRICQARKLHFVSRLDCKLMGFVTQAARAAV